MVYKTLVKYKSQSVAVLVS